MATRTALTPHSAGSTNTTNTTGKTDTARTGPPAAGAPGPLPRRKLIVIFVGLILGILMAALDQTIVATALPTIAADLNGLEQISWIITIYLLGQTIAMPIYGRVGDLIGRRNAFHVAIVIFLAGSVVAGLSQDMGMLIACRAVQGIGAGGLMIGAQTIMAEIVSARERGKYMSIMGPMIGVATVLGPLLGGYLTEHASWRWIFYINVPIGIAALVVTSLSLYLPRPQRRRRVDYSGMVLMAGAVACLVLLLTWGGRRYEWTSPQIVALGIGVLALTPLWLWVESRAAEPILPLRLFRNGVFRVNVVLAFLLGVAMFGAVSYLPTYLQLSLGASATTSGLLMLPLMGGLMAAAVTTGQLITRTGRYKVFPILGTSVAAVGMFLLSRMDAGTSRLQSSVFMVVLGLGIGFIMPTLVLVVQNAVSRPEVGAATAGVNFFRQIGASVGTALIGSLFVSRLGDRLALNLPPDAAAHLNQAGEQGGSLTPDQLAQLPEPIAHAVVVSYAEALIPLYFYLVPLLVLGLVVACFLEEKPLTTSVGGRPAPGSPHPGGAHADPGAAPDARPVSHRGAAPPAHRRPAEPTERPEPPGDSIAPEHPERPEHGPAGGERRRP
ncbi:DHA2 family efflux MFS transporter permease subunit [Pseudactinotalea sp. HY160]|uniref:MDR family MFS transporter n=1 Tax=Pseudactinotalea sp. HY160 TaxID=2654490 RepID=UPI00351AB2E4